MWRDGVWVMGYGLWAMGYGGIVLRPLRRDSRQEATMF